MCCRNYKGIKLLRTLLITEACKEHNRCDVCLRLLMGKYRSLLQVRSFTTNLDIKDIVTKEGLWYCMTKSGVAETYLRVVQAM